MKFDKLIENILNENENYLNILKKELNRFFDLKNYKQISNEKVKFDLKNEDGNFYNIEIEAYSFEDQLVINIISKDFPNANFYTDAMDSAIDSLIDNNFIYNK
jgi:hypothetical protein